MFELAWPWIWLLFPLPWLLRWLLPVSESGDAALKIGFLPELETLAGRRAAIALPAWRQQLPFLIIWVLLLSAAARPQWLGEPLPMPTNGRDLLLAVDVSGSMDFPDMQWQGEEISRLELVKHLLGEFIAERRGDRVGLILFGSKAYLQAPLTFDRQTVRTWLDEAVIGIAGSNTALGDAIGLAVKRLRDRPAKSRVLVLITDGANNGGEVEPLLAARLAAAAGIKVHTIGIGAEADNSILDRFGFNPGGDLDETTLRAIAHETGGEYFRARTQDELKAVGATLDQLEPAAQQPAQVRVATALYHWPLSVALLISWLLVARSVWHRSLRRFGRWSKST